MVSEPAVRFGRRPSHDGRDAAFPLRTALGRPLKVPPFNYWDYSFQPLDQKDSGTCVSHAGKNWMLTKPITQTSPDTPPLPLEMYRQIVLLDDFADNDHEATAPDDQLVSGTSTRALFKWLTQQGYCKEYRWANNIRDVTEWIALRGPMVFGTAWYEGMMDVDGRGYIHRNGANLGGHAYVGLGVNFDRRDVTIMNSWGQWGIVGTGRARISFTDLEHLLFAEYGEAAAGLEVPLPA